MIMNGFEWDPRNYYPSENHAQIEDECKMIIGRAIYSGIP